MDLQDAALIAAGLIGSGVAVAHGAVLQQLMVRPIDGLLLADKAMPAPAARLVAPLLHFSTFNWFLGGLALFAAAFWMTDGARFATAALVGSSYLYGALINLWGTRGRHPGWILYAIALCLIAFGAMKPGA